MKSKGIDIYIDNLGSKDDNIRYNALQEILKITEQPVEWFEEYYKIFVDKLDSDNSYQRSIGMMVLCNLVKNESKNEYKEILPKIMKLVDDEKFITERQYLQNIWKIAVHESKYKVKIVKQLEIEYGECEKKKHYNLLRLDIIVSMYNISKKENDKELLDRIKRLIEKENDVKNRKKYQSVIK